MNLFILNKKPFYDTVFFIINLFIKLIELIILII